MRTWNELCQDVMKQREEDNANKVFLTGRQFQVTEEEREAYGNKLLDYDLVTHEPVKPDVPAFIVKRGGEVYNEEQ